MSENAVVVRAPSLGDFTAEDIIKAAQAAAGEVTKGTADGESMREAMGNQKPKLERVKVRHNGSAIFTRGEQRVDFFVGSIIANTFPNSYYDTPFEERVVGARPPCFSHDGINIADNAESPQNPGGGCNTCSRNRNARDSVARQAAFKRDRTETCSNYLTLAVLLPGEEIPVLIQFSQGSFDAWAEYAQQISSKGRYRTHEVLTKISLKNVRNKGGTETSVGVFSMVGPLPKDVAAAIAVQVPAYKAVLLREAGDAEREQTTTSASDAVREAKAAAEKAKSQGPGI